MIFIRAGLFPLTVTRETRADYITALEAADGGDLLPLAKFFGQQERSSLLKAMSLMETVIEANERLDDVLDAARDRLVAVREAQSSGQETLFQLCKHLESRSLERLRVAAVQITDRLVNYSAVVGSSEDNQAHAFLGFVREAAEQNFYSADTLTYYAWTGLMIHEQRKTWLVLAYHGLGSPSNKVAAVTPLLVRADEEKMDADTVQRVEIPFVFSDSESVPTVERRFLEWLDETIISGLDQWQRNL